MPIDSRELGRTRAARTGAAGARLISTINEPTPCSGCGYNIIGMRTDGVCPECGKPIHQRMRRVFSRHEFIDSPRWYLWSIALAGLLLTVGWSLMPVAWIVNGHVNEAGGALLFLVAASVWWVGVFIVTRPRPIEKSHDTDPHTEWFAARLAARVTQACWVLFGAVGVVTASGGVGGGGAASESLGAIGGVAFLIACVGLVAVFIALSNITFWASDTASSEAYRTMLWILPLSTYLATMFYGPNGGLSSVAALLPTKFAPTAGLMIFLAAIFILLPEAWLAWTLWGLARLGYWAVQNQVSVQERDERLRERSQATAALGGLPPSGVDPTTLPGFALGESDVPASAAPTHRRSGRAGLIKRAKHTGDEPRRANQTFD